MWPYSERSSIGVESYVSELFADPGIPISDEDKRSAREFAAALFGGHFGELVNSTRNLEDILQTSIASSSQNYYLDYFKTEKGFEDLQKLGIETENPEALKVKLFGLAVAENPVKPTLRKTVANNSLNWYKQELARRLQNDSSQDSEQADSEIISVNFAPDKLLDKFAELKAYRLFYRQVKLGLRADADSDLTAAKRVLIDIHIAKVNDFVAELYPSLKNLAAQLSYLPDSSQALRWQAQLQEVAPVAAKALGQSLEQRKEFGQGFARRLDLLKHGGAWRGEPNVSPISPELTTLADELSEENRTNQIEVEQGLPIEVIEKLKTTHWNADELKNFCEEMLSEWNLLSEFPINWEEADERSGQAADKKWQVIISPKVTSLSLEGSKKTVTVPQIFHRSLSQSLPVAAHELTHVLQYEYDQVAGQDIPLICLKGRRNLTGREMGGIFMERELLAMLGQSRPTNLTYLRALEAKLSGANQTEAARAFVEASTDDTPFKDQAVVAGKNTLRLYRSGGHNSQPLDYAEQELMRRGLDNLGKDRARAVAIAGVSLSLRDAAALHRFGLFSLPEQVPERPAQDVLRVFIEKFYTS